MQPKLKVLDLFAGIGGFTIGLENTGGFETVAFCEIDPYAQAVLNQHWPDIPIYPDVKKLKGEDIGKIDIITGGFPCQDLSIAGKQAGIKAGRSGLWSEIVRLACEIRPRYIFVENVANLLSGPSEQRGAWFGEVLRDLASIGYDAEWHCSPAYYLGSPQERDRVWLVAYPAGRLQQSVGSRGNIGRLQEEILREGWNIPDLETEPCISRVADGVPARSHRIRCCGNAVFPKFPEAFGHAILTVEASLQDASIDK